MAGFQRSAFSGPGEGDADRHARLTAELARGDLSPLVGWLRASVHARASLHDFRGLMTAATGRPLDPAAFTDHLRKRYLDD